MTLTLRADVNGTPVADISIQRLAPIASPTEADMICTYRVCAWRLRIADHGPVINGALLAADFEHRYGDGMFLLTRKALAALKLEPELPVDDVAAAWAESAGPCYICGDVANHGGRTHAEATGQQLTRADADTIRAHRPAGKPTRGEEDWLVRFTDWMPGDDHSEYLQPRLQVVRESYAAALLEGDGDLDLIRHDPTGLYVRDEQDGQHYRLDVQLVTAAEAEGQ